MGSAASHFRLESGDQRRWQERRGHARNRRRIGNLGGGSAGGHHRRFAFESAALREVAGYYESETRHDRNHNAAGAAGGSRSRLKDDESESARHAAAG